MKSSAKDKEVIKYYFKTNLEALQLTRKARLLSCLPPGIDMVPGVACWMKLKKAEEIREKSLWCTVLLF